MSARKDKIDSVLSTYGSDIIVRTKSYGAKNDFGVRSVSTTNDRTIKAVKDNYLQLNAQLNETGRMSAASSTLIVQADESFTANEDEIVFDGKSYYIMQIQPLELSGEVLANLLEIAEA